VSDVSGVGKKEGFLMTIRTGIRAKKAGKTIKNKKNKKKKKKQIHWLVDARRGPRNRVLGKLAKKKRHKKKRSRRGVPSAKRCRMGLPGRRKNVGRDKGEPVMAQQSKRRASGQKRSNLIEFNLKKEKVTGRENRTKKTVKAGAGGGGWGGWGGVSCSRTCSKNQEGGGGK